jgi:hypothetical protein
MPPPVEDAALGGSLQQPSAGGACRPVCISTFQALSIFISISRRDSFGYNFGTDNSIEGTIWVYCENIH